VSAQPGVWVTPRAAVASHWRKVHPFTPALAHDAIYIPKNIDPYPNGSKPIGIDNIKVDVLGETEKWKHFLPPRDFTGYGFETPTGDVWPKGAKIAVSFVLNYEEGAEHTPWNGDAHTEQFLNEANYFRERVYGRRDMYTESLYVSLVSALSQFG
jgi:hypothetical protein